MRGYARLRHSRSCSRSGKRPAAPAYSIHCMCRTRAGSAQRLSNYSQTVASGRISTQPSPLRLAVSHSASSSAFCSGSRRPLSELLEPLMTVLNAIPRVILAPLFVIWLGIGLASKVALSFILVAVLIFSTVFTGIRQVDRRLVERVVTLGGDRWALVRHVYLPSVAAWVLGNLKIAVGFAFAGACVGEFVAATHGLGYLLSFAQSTYNAALMFALILLILVVVLLIFGVAGRLEKYLLRWN